MAGGPSTPALAAAVSNAGALGFVAAGYRSPQGMLEDIAATRALTDRPFGVNVFVPGAAPADAQEVERYGVRLRQEALRAGIQLGTARFDDDGFAEKVQMLIVDPVSVVSFTFGCPVRDVVDALKAAGSEVWVTVTNVEEGRQAAAAGASALVAQGMEAGGHRGSFVDRADADDLSVLSLLQLLDTHIDLPFVASGGLATGKAIAAVLAAGAVAAQVGTAFMLCPEAATSTPHRTSLASTESTAPTRAFTGRLARGIRNRLMLEHGAHAPIAYPEIHFLTAPLRAHGRESGDASVINLWAGQTHELAEERPAAEVVERLYREAIGAMETAQSRLKEERPPGHA
jgi:nitronate monooxygenase